MIESICAIIAFFIGYKIGTMQIERIVKKEIERQLYTLSEWTMKNEN